MQKTVLAMVYLKLQLVTGISWGRAHIYERLKGSKKPV